MIPVVEKVLFLKGVDLFAALSAEDLAEVAEVTEEVTSRAGERLVSEGELGESLYFVIEGRVVVRHGGRVIAELAERDLFGEMALLDPGPRSATVEALSDVRLLVLPRDDLEDLMRDRPEVPIAILKVLVRRLRSANAGAR